MAEISSEIIDGVKVTTDKNGNQHFELLDKTSTKHEIDNRNWWQKIKDWFNDSKVTPYVNVRDLSDPLDQRKNDPFDDGSGSKNAAEIGLKIKF